MAVICSQCGKHIGPMNDGGERWLCSECIAAGHRLPERDADGSDD